MFKNQKSIIMIWKKLLFLSLLLSFLSLDEFGLANIRHNNNNNHHNRNNSYINNKKTKVSNKQKFFDNNSHENEAEEFILYNNNRKRDKNNNSNSNNNNNNSSSSSNHNYNHHHHHYHEQPKRNINRKQYRRSRVSSSKFHSQNPLYWKLVWDPDWEMEFSAGLSTLHILPNARHVSAYLGKGVLGRFLFFNNKGDTSLSISVTPCTSILRWSVSMIDVNETNFGKIMLKNSSLLETFRTQRLNVLRIFKSHFAVYMIEIRPLYADTFVQVLASRSKSIQPITTTSKIDAKIETGKARIMSTTSDKMTSFNYNFILASQLFLNPKVLVKRLSGNRIQVKWDSSPINPKYMEYCIVVNTRRDYSTLCEAQGCKYGISPPNLLDLPYYVRQRLTITEITTTTTTVTPTTSTESIFTESESIFTEEEGESQQFSANTSSINDGYVNDMGMRLSEEDKDNNNNFYYQALKSINEDDFIIGCINRRTNYVLTDLKEGRLYYFNVFLKDRKTNLTYPYVRTTLKYKIPKADPNLLRDSKPLKVRLNDNINEPITLKFILRKQCTELTMYIMPCGGGVFTYDVLVGNHTLYHSSIVESLDIVKVAEVQPGIYYVKIQSFKATINYNNNNINNFTNERQLYRARMVEVYLSVKNKKFPLPRLPEITRITEVLEEKTCDSVTIQWWASPDSRDNEYCIFLKLEERQRLFKFKLPNQCDVERSLKNDPYVSHSMCLERSPESSSKPLQQKISGLQSSKTYELQLIVRRHNRKSLSYDLFHVSTLENCNEIFVK